MIIGRVTFLIGKAIVVSLDGSSRELRLGDNIDSTETIKVSAGGEVVITDNNGVDVSINGNESWTAENGQFNNLPQVDSSEIDTSTIDPTSVEAIQAALLAGIDPTTIGEATAAGNQGGGDQQLGSEGSSFVRVGRGNTSSIDSGLDFDTIAQGANTLENSVFDTLLRAESSEPTEPFTGVSTTPPLTGFTAFDDVDSNGLAGPREVISNNSFTNDSTPIYSGSATPGSIIRIYDNNVLVTTTTVDADGNWEIQSPELEDTTHSITVTAQQEGSIESAPNGPLNFTVDTSIPTQTAVITNVYDDVNEVGDIASGGITDDTAPQLQGTLSAVLASDEVLNVLRDDVVIGQAIIDATDPANVTWIFDDSALVDGVEYAYQVQVVDAASNAGDLSNSYSININSSAPTQNITIDFITDNVDPQLGDFDSGSSSNDVTPLINGGIDQALAADEYIIVFRDGIEIGQAVVDSSDPNAITWSLLDDVAGNTLEDGESYQYTARVFDGSGNGGTLSDVFDLSIDTTAPIAAIVDLSDNSDTFLDFFGAQIGSKTDDKTLDKQLEFNGQLSAADAGSVIVFYAYATQAKKEGGQISDTGEVRVLLDGVDSTVYSATNRFVLGTAIVEADGKYVMRMEDTDGSPLLSSANAVYNGVLVDQYYIHVNAIVTDLAGNNSEVSDDLDITIDTRSANANTRDPLILDLNNDGTYTSSINRGVKFDHDGDGEKEHSGWVSANDGFLALDINNDGEINDGSELFGNDTVLGASSGLAGDGFEALAQYDSDNNNIIDANDDVYDDLRVWIDQNQNGQSDDGELKTLSELNIESISLEATDTDDVDHGNDIIKAGTFVQNGEVKSIVDADLALGPNGDAVSFIELLVDDKNISAEEIGDSSTVDSTLRIKVILPFEITNGEYLIIAVNGAAGTYSFTHLVQAVDSEQGFVNLFIPNAAIQTEGEFVDGDYSLSLIVSNDMGATTVYPGEETFKLSVESVDLEDALSNDQMSLEVAAIDEQDNDDSQSTNLSTLLGDDLEFTMINDEELTQEHSFNQTLAQLNNGNVTTLEDTDNTDQDAIMALDFADILAEEVDVDISALISATTSVDGVEQQDVELGNADNTEHNASELIHVITSDDTVAQLLDNTLIID